MQALFLFTTVGVLIANLLADIALRLPRSAGPEDGGGMTIQGSIPAPDGPGAGDTERVGVAVYEAARSSRGARLVRHPLAQRQVPARPGDARRVHPGRASSRR